MLLKIENLINPRNKYKGDLSAKLFPVVQL